MEEIIKAGVIALVLDFVIISLYIFISGPFDAISTDIEDLDMSASDSHVETISGLGRTVFNIIFIGLGVAPWIWMVLKLLHREPEWRF